MSASKGQDPLIGHLLAGKYRIERQIGHGGMGAVYQGLHVLMERPVAIKVVNSRWAAQDPSCLNRFQMEAKASSCLNHPNIMTVFDFGINENGIAYLVMDYIDGEGLDDILRREKRLPLDRVIDIFGQACDALAHAHEKGVVHRDLKPSNIMVSRDRHGRERVKIVDFGIAKLMPERAHAIKFSPRDSQVVGSPLYMSPEQCTGDSKLDGRSDIYSLGCLLYHSLTGRAPVQEETVLGIIYAHINQMPLPFGTAVPELGLPPEIEAVVFKALSKDADKRQQSMHELRAELETAAAAFRSYQQAPDTVAKPPVVSRELSHFEAGSPELVPHLHNLADFYQANNQHERAEEHLRSAVRCLVDSYGVWDVRVGEAVKKLADFYRDLKRYKDAEPLYLDLLAIKRKAFGHSHPDIPCILLRIADVYFHINEFESARKYYSRCLKLSQQMFGADDPVLTPILTGLASSLRRLEREEEAAIVYKRALSLKESHLGPDHYELASTLVGLGVAYRFQDNFDEAERVLKRALLIYQNSVGPAHFHVASVQLLLAELYSAQGLNQHAEERYSQAVAIRQMKGGNELQVAAAYDVWAAHYLRRQDLEAAETIYRKALSIRETALGSNHPQIANSLSILAALYQAQNNYSAAEAFYKRAVACASLPEAATAKLSEL